MLFFLSVGSPAATASIMLVTTSLSYAAFFEDIPGVPVCSSMFLCASPTASLPEWITLMLYK